MRKSSVLFSILSLVSILSACSENGAIEDKCSESDCSGHGYCVMHGRAPECICDEGYYPGDSLSCVDALNACDDPTVCIGGECKYHGTTPYCECPDGYKANNDTLACDVDTEDPCFEYTCSGHGHCAKNGDTPECVCDTGYKAGENMDCVLKENACDDASLCANGTCKYDKSNEPYCECPSGYTANNASLTCTEDKKPENTTDPCDSYTCSGHGHCVVHGTQPECLCDSGYYADDKNMTCLSKASACEQPGVCTGGTCKYDKSNEPYCECPDQYLANNGNLTCNPLGEDADGNHMIDAYQKMASDYGKSCNTDDDCDGFCDSFLGNVCSQKCTSDDQCISDDSNVYVCRSDGRCAPDSFVTRWKPIESLTIAGTEYKNVVVFPVGNGTTCNYTIEYSDGETEKVTRCSNYDTSSLKTMGHIHSFKSVEADGLVTIKVTGRIDNWTCGYTSNIEPRYLDSSELCSYGATCTVSGWENCCGKSSNCTKKFKTMCSNLVSVESFGPVKLAPFAFYGAKSLVSIKDVDIPDSSQLNSLKFMFYQNEALTDAHIDRWDTSNVKNMRGVFYQASGFNGALTYWNTANVTDMKWAFLEAAKFDQPLNHWNTSKVTDMQCMFQDASAFNKDLDTWDTSNVRDIRFMFHRAKNFNGDITTWNTSKITSLNNLFPGAVKFNQPIGNWDVSNVTNMVRVFYSTYAFNQNLNKWNVSKVKDMQYMFYNSTGFNQPLGDWDVSNVENFESMFDSAKSFNQDLSKWNISKATNIRFMFRHGRAFNKDISSWDTARIQHMDCMFYGAVTFNKDISKWNTGKVQYMNRMFHKAEKFNQDLSDWDLSSLILTKNNAHSQIFLESGMSQENLDKMRANNPIWKQVLDMNTTSECGTIGHL